MPRTLAWHPLLIALLPFVLIAGCWRADFIGYDDPMHVSENAQIAEPLNKLFEFNPAFPYFPVTLLTYKIDHTLFAGWMPGVLGSWAPGVRFMTLLYHIGAALVLWRLLLRMKLPPPQSLFIACVFGVHPLASETVCWASERKNATAALFGFLALWAWARWEGRAKGIALATLFFGLALLCKQSVLGLLPFFALYELFGGARGLSGEAPMRWHPRHWPPIVLRVLPPALLALAMIVFTLRIMTGQIVPPPGGSLFTALLTDLEILCRYLFNLAIPVNLSAVYGVTPIRSIFDGRAVSYAMILAGVIGFTFWYSQNRRLALFGWLWLIGSLGPNLNLVSIPHLMQDRYLYLGTAGFFLVVTEFFAGLKTHFPSRQSHRLTRIGMSLGGAYLLFLAVLSAQRSPIWESSYTLFSDVVAKQPQAMYGRYGLGKTHKDYHDIFSAELAKLSVDPAANEERKLKLQAAIEAHRRGWLQHWALGVNCPDAPRFNMYLKMALELGYESIRMRRAQYAEVFWSICLKKPHETIDDPLVRAEAMGSLASLWLDQGKIVESYALAQRALKLDENDTYRILVARTALARAKVPGESRTAEFKMEARSLLKAVQADSSVYGTAQEYLRDPVLAAP